MLFVLNREAAARPVVEEDSLLGRAPHRPADGEAARLGAGSKQVPQNSVRLVSSYRTSHRRFHRTEMAGIQRSPRVRFGTSFVAALLPR